MGIIEANRQMEHYRPLLGGRHKIDETGGSQHSLDGDKDKFACYRCERSKPDCNGARNCTFDKKADGSAVNSQEMIASKIQDMRSK